MLTDARRRTLELAADLTDEQLRVPLLSIINPPVWEMGHVAWFQEKWTLRNLDGKDSIRPWADAAWDSAAVAHDDRWGVAPVPSREETLHYMHEVLDRAIDRLPDGEISDRDAYFYWLVAMHEDMHGEAFTYTRQTLGFAAPRPMGSDGAAPAKSPGRRGDVFVPGGTYLLGARPGESLVFDNEKWEHEVEVKPFSIARTAVSNGEFAAFVNDGGYRRTEFWSDEGNQWREREKAVHPAYWIPQSGGRWLRKHFDRVVPLEEDAALIHVHWYEAEAYCRWAKRRLPAEAEWEMAAATAPGSSSKRRFPWGDEPPKPESAQLDARHIGCISVDALPAGDSALGCRQMMGNVWEWTSTDFLPYPGFVIDPYKEYSEPWFGPERKVLRGGCWATRSRLIRNTWRNFYPKDRRDVFGGFRTCAV